MLVLGDVSVGVHPKHLRVGNDGKCTHILQITLILHEGKGGRRKIIVKHIVPNWYKDLFCVISKSYQLVHFCSIIR